MNAIFRLRRSYRNQGFGYLVGFLAWFVLNIWVIWTIPKDPNRVAPVAAWVALVALLGGVPLLMAGLSAWMLAAYWREELTIQGERVTFRGIFREKAFDLGEVIEARWRTGSGLVLRTESTRLTISLSNYEAEEQEQIIHHIRSVLPPEIQVGWNLFAYRAERQAAQAAKTKPGPDEVLVGRDRLYRIFVPSLAVFSLAGVVAWWFTGRLGYLAFPVVPLVLWAVFWAMTPAKPVVEQKLSAVLRTDELRFITLWFLVAFAGLGVNEYFRPRMEKPDAILIVGAVVWFGVLMFEGFRDTRRQSRRDREAADLAAKARGEPVADSWRADDGSG